MSCTGVLVAMGYEGSYRTTRRAVAEAKRRWRNKHGRRTRPWIPQPGLWLQWDYGDGPEVAGRRAVLFCAWLAWSRFRVVVPLVDKTLASVVIGLDRTLRYLNGAERLTGRLDPPLTERGEREAVALASRLADERWDLVVHSGARRARETLLLALSRSLGAPPAEVVVEPRLLERAYGAVEGGPATRWTQPADVDAAPLGRAGRCAS